jgi:hypothetical protein
MDSAYSNLRIGITKVYKFWNINIFRESF